ALVVLTLIEMGTALNGIAAAAQVAVLLALAYTKALLVALYYMHLKFEGPIIRIIAAVPMLLVLIVILIPIFDVWIFG
ncbi:MAG: cytochrome C oxidase subunit IV family protein, partial [Nitrospirae bacterium]|nr:cytochrome C oxidase subunit IV family protein [Nitrospirota bacterium]